MLLLHGKGLWLQRIAECEHGDLSAIIARAQAARLAHLILKIADGADAYNVDPATGRDLAAELTLRLSEAGIDVWGWHTLYGEKPAFKGQLELDYHLREAEAGIARANALRSVGLKGLVLDARSDYERIPQRARRAEQFMARLRAALDLPLALSAWKSPGAHPRFPWKEFREPCDLDLPQVFWIGRYGEAARQLENSAAQFAAQAPRRPYAAAGPGFFEANWRPAPGEINEFLVKAVELSLPAANLWLWDHLGLTGDEPQNPGRWDFSAHWQALAQFEWRGPTIEWTPAEAETVEAGSLAQLLSEGDEPLPEHLREFAVVEEAGEGAQSIAELVAEDDAELPEHLREESAPLAEETPLQHVATAVTDHPLPPLAPEYAEPAEPAMMARAEGETALEEPTRETLEAESAEPAPPAEPLIATLIQEIVPPSEPASVTEAPAPDEKPVPPEWVEPEAPVEPPVGEIAPEPLIVEPVEPAPPEEETPEWLREPTIAPITEPALAADGAPTPAPEAAEISFGIVEPESNAAPAFALRDELPEWLHDVEAADDGMLSFGVAEASAPEPPPLERVPNLPEFAPAFADRDRDEELPEWLREEHLAHGEQDEAQVSFGLEPPEAVEVEDYSAELEALLKDDAPDELPEWLREPNRAVSTSPVSAPQTAPVHPTITQFFKALRTGKLGEAMALYGPGFAHANPERVAHEMTEVYEFYHRLGQAAQIGTLGVASTSGSAAALTVRWTMRDAAGAVLQGADTFHLNRAGQIVYHHTSYRPLSTAQPTPV